jgi:transcriptional regulator EpsA
MEDEILIRNRAELDTLLVNLEAAVRVGKRSDFFSWVQGVFQGIIGHDLLICALPEPGTRSFRMDWMSSRPLDEGLFSELCSPAGGLVHRLIAYWEKTGRHPIVLAEARATPFAADGLAAEVLRLKLGEVVAHGVPDAAGRAAGFFMFSWLSTRGVLEHRRALQLMAPYLHAAWARANCEADEAQALNRLVTRDVLTTREVEILNWVEQGKSNNEIAQILAISHLTVKNHVQKILRKLNVQNRAQAVAKGISLNLTHGLDRIGRN